MSMGTAILDLLFPPRCPYCQRILEKPREAVCPRCQGKLPWLKGKAGERRVDFTKNCFSPLAYRGAAAEAVRRYKFRPVRAYAAPFGEVMAQCLLDHLPEGADLVTWCPLSKKRRRERGFDQSELLARAVGKRLGLPVAGTLKKVKHTSPQSGLEEESARRANARGAYVVLPECGLRGRRVVLVDDVVTSGATLSECAGLLMMAGAEEVYGLTLAQARRDQAGIEQISGENC